MRAPVSQEESKVPDIRRSPPVSTQTLRFRAELGLEDSELSSVLFALHNPPDPAWLGGTERHCMEVAAELTSLEVFWLYADPESMVLLEGRSPYRELLRVPLLPPQSSDQLFHPGFARHFETLLRQLQVGVVHVHHLLNLPLDVLRIPPSLGVPTLFTVHDYFTVCPQFNLVDFRETYCAGNLTGPRSRCAECMAKRMGMDLETLDRWRTAVGGVLPELDGIVAPSYAALERVEACYPGATEGALVIPHGLSMEEDSAEESSSSSGRPSSGRLTVAFAGTLTIAKGAALLAEILADSRARSFRWKIFGQGGFRQEWLDALPGDLEVEWLGSYAFGSLPELLKRHGVDILIFPAIWPETYSYVVAEAFHAGVPVLTTDLGAPAERVRDGGAGWTFDPGAPGQALEILQRLDGDRKEIWCRGGNALRRRSRTIQAMAEDYLRLYLDRLSPLDPGDPEELEHRTLELFHLARSRSSTPSALEVIDVAPEGERSRVHVHRADVARSTGPRLPASRIVRFAKRALRELLAPGSRWR